jgi:predicted phosphoribosyltransferase
MYFKSRVVAGQQLAAKLVPKYRYENCAVVALSDGAVVVGAQIASQLHCVLTLLLTEAISLPGEPVPVASVDQDGGFAWGGMFSTGQLEEINNEFHGLIEQEKREKLSAMNRLLGQSGIINKDLLRDHNVILVSDGLNSAYSLDAAANYLKPIRMDKLIVATPLASVPAVDRMHLLADEILCLDVVDNFMDLNHYYEDNTILDHETTVKTIQNIVLKWQ